ncbi:hypothetical protein BH79_31810 [Pseudomonas aeruginosa C0324C]|nr:hypothetical protein BH79_31810 [Pseudomonas aeruginosa C0324C]
MYIALKISLFMACLLPSLFFAQGARAEYYYWYMGHFDKKVSRRRVAIFISLVYLAIQGGFLLWSFFKSK